MIEPQVLQVGASPKSTMLESASAAWIVPGLSSRFSGLGGPEETQGSEITS
jgi:hypothetical protein